MIFLFFWSSLAHLEPELELFEDDDGGDDLSNQNVHNYIDITTVNSLPFIPLCKWSTGVTQRVTARANTALEWQGLQKNQRKQKFCWNKFLTMKNLCLGQSQTRWSRVWQTRSIEETALSQWDIPNLALELCIRWRSKKNFPYYLKSVPYCRLLATRRSVWLSAVLLSLQNLRRWWICKRFPITSEEKG